MASSTSKGRLAGKVAIVTGGGSGFGAAISSKFASEGCKVVISDINTVNGESVASTNPSHLLFHKSDVTSLSDWQAMLAYTHSQFGRLDILVNNAGTTYPNKPTTEVTEAEFDKVFNVNVKSIYFSIAVIIPYLIKQGIGGSIINIASIGALRPRPGLVWYNATKGAVANATKGLAGEYAPHQIRVNGILPLLSGTGLFKSFTGLEHTEENVREFIGNVPMGRLTDPGDVANAAVYFAGEESEFVTGTNLEIDGGRSIA